ncbi:hypothetical protein BGZ63DRAFT_172910 [Mariannaea sp. PMI_226]|nr:hypothetical protein BGZ63DRAFT_172910 [Mariannaea sp. PMI_226]
MHATKALKYSKRDFKVESVTFFTDQALVQRVVPISEPGKISIVVSGFGSDVKFSSIRLEPPRDSGICVRGFNVVRQNKSNVRNAVRNSDLQQDPTQCSVLDEPLACNKEARCYHYSIRIWLEFKPSIAPAAETAQLRLVYTTSSMHWSAFHVLDLHSQISSAILVTMAKLHNLSSEDWDTCKVILSSRQCQAASGASHFCEKVHLQRSFYQTRGRDQITGKFEEVAQPSHSPGMPSEHSQQENRQRTSSEIDQQIRQHIQAHGQACQCLEKRVGPDTTWVISGQAFFAGVTTLAQPISCVKFGNVVICREFDDVGGGGFNVKVWGEPITPVFPGPVQVMIDNNCFHEVAMPARFPLDPIQFTCMDKY